MNYVNLQPSHWNTSLYNNRLLAPFGAYVLARVLRGVLLVVNQPNHSRSRGILVDEPVEVRALLAGFGAGDELRLVDMPSHRVRRLISHVRLSLEDG